jgi:sodium transport system permease protein
LLLVPQLGLILAPAVLMATVLTTSLKQSFRVRMPGWGALPVALLLGLTLHPSYVTLGQWITEMFPISEQAQAALAPMGEMIGSASWLQVLFLLALVPAICEELAFRGFLFSGLQRDGGQLRAIVVTAVLFGASHGGLQQSLAAGVMGLLLGWVALRTGSLLPGLIIHFTNNGLSVSLERLARWDLPGTEFFIRTTAEGGVIYQPLWTLLASGVAVTCLLYFSVAQSAEAEEEQETFPLPSPAADPGLTPLT